MWTGPAYLTRVVHLALSTNGLGAGRRRGGPRLHTSNVSRQFASLTAGYLLICSSAGLLHYRLVSHELPVFASGLDVEHVLKGLEEKYIEFPSV